MYEDADGVDETKSRRLIGKLLYVTHSRPNIAFLVNLLERFTHKPTRIHQGAAKHILRYLAGTIDFGILYCTSYDELLQGFFR